MRYKFIVTKLFFVFVFISCKNTETNTSNLPLFKFEKINSSSSGIDFENEVKNQKDFNILTYRNFYNGGGVAVGDVNNDGLKDIYFTANLTDNKLYLNKGNFKFEDITEQAKVAGKKAWATGVTMADVNADGWLDIYVCYSGEVASANKENELFINQKDGTFIEQAKEYGLNDKGLSTHAAFFDYDMDGDLDCFVLNNSYKDPDRVNLFKRSRIEIGAEGGDRLYRNDLGKFVDVTATSGIFSSNIGFGLGVSVGDINGDFWPDIYISNDFWERDYLYINQKNGTFSEELTDRMSYSSTSSMGSDMADLNNDGHYEIFSTDMLPPDNFRLKAATKFDDYYFEDIKFKNSYYHQFLQNCLQVNDGNGHFNEIAHFAGVAATDWSWGALIFDMNMDGNKDIFVSNGVYQDITNLDFVDFIADKDKVQGIISEKGRFDFRDFEKYLPNNKRKNYSFINNEQLIFENLNDKLGLDEASYSNGSAYADFDNDGDYDLVVNNVNMEAFLYKNTSTENGQNYIKLSAKGNDLNKYGIGLTAQIYQKGSMQTSYIMPSRGFQSSSDYDLIFGLGQNTTIDSVIVIWPDLKFQKIKEPKVNQTLKIDYKDAGGNFQKKALENSPIFGRNDFSQINHIENIYNDFDADRLMPHMMSNEGPKIINGDINGDGNEDFILAGAKGDANKVYVYSNGTYKEMVQPAFDTKNMSDATSGVLFDADGDKDLDLLVGFGGNEFKNNKDSYKLQYFLNNGRGIFTKDTLAFPSVYGQIGVITTADYDKDGDQDIFVGCSAIPGLYGLTPRSYFLQNEGKGKFTDITNNFTGPVGMVKDAAWGDIDANGWADLIIVGEWMPITILLNDQGQLSAPVKIDNSEGWWNCLKIADIDKDGDLDFLAGNWGLNMKLKASLNKPLSLHINDFDNDKRPDSILEWYTPEDTQPFPFASKSDLTAKFPILKKSILKYSQYAEKGIADLFPEAKNTEIKKVSTFATTLFINEGEKGIKMVPFNTEAQLSPVSAIILNDVDTDGVLDVVLGGNFYKLKPEIGRHDGLKGGYFKGVGNGKFQFITTAKSGINISGEVRDIKYFNNKIHFARNNNSLVTFSKSTN